VRIDQYLSQAFPYRSRREWKTLLREGKIRQGQRVIKASDSWSEDLKLDLSALDLAFWEYRTGLFAKEKARALALIRYEDEDFLVLNKSAGMPSHPLSIDDEVLTAADCFALKDPEFCSSGEILREGGLLHRLDNQTSGLLVAARSRKAWLENLANFRSSPGKGDMDQSGSVLKTYLAIIQGRFAGPLYVDLPLAHSALDPRKMLVPGSRFLDGAYRSSPRAAFSSLEALAFTDDLSLLKVEIRQGQRHQIRAHCASIGFPLAGDSLYGAVFDERFGHFMLHAWRLKCRSLGSNSTFGLEAELPDEFLRYFPLEKWANC